MKNKLIIGGGVVLLAWSAWFIFAGNISIENIADDVAKREPTSSLSANSEDFIDSLTMEYDTVDTGVFIGDEDADTQNVSEKEDVLAEFADKYISLVEKKDFKALCVMLSTCNENTEDYKFLEQKEKDYESHVFTYWFPNKNNNNAIGENEQILCYEETIKLKNDSNKNPIVYTYHVEIAEKSINTNQEKNKILEFKKPRCEKVVKLPYGDLTNRSPYNTRCGKNITRILCEK